MSELSKADREVFMERLTLIIAARQAIEKKCGAFVKGQSPTQVGVIDCPMCGMPDGLRFTRSGYNGHVHGHCKTEDCLSWME